MKTTVVSLRHNIPFDIRIDRQTPWGNPFCVGRDGTRKMVVQKHIDWLRAWLVDRKEIIITLASMKLSNKWQVEHLDELVGKILACWCDPLPCHGNNFIKMIGELKL